MTFELVMNVKGTLYRMQVTRTVANTAIEEYKVEGGTKRVVFRCNRPDPERIAKKQRIKWQVISKNFSFKGKLEVAAQRMLDLQDALEDKITQKPSWTDVRNKTIE
ncbi:MAG TPA: hypothetical protein VM843_03930 [Flavisolibacter sp.]|jgi:hypothetical protein|nr:hypothetical protein [Flavisolibacter sp.]